MRFFRNSLDHVKDSFPSRAGGDSFPPGLHVRSSLKANAALLILVEELPAGGEMREVRQTNEIPCQKLCFGETGLVNVQHFGQLLETLSQILFVHGGGGSVFQAVFTCRVEILRFHFQPLLHQGPLRGRLPVEGSSLALEFFRDVPNDCP